MAKNIFYYSLADMDVGPENGGPVRFGPLGF